MAKRVYDAAAIGVLASQHPLLNSPEYLTRNSHRLTGQAHERPAITSLRLLAVLNGL
jgi:hypothetical protein